MLKVPVLVAKIGFHSGRRPAIVSPVKGYGEVLRCQPARRRPQSQRQGTDRQAEQDTLSCLSSPDSGFMLSVLVPTHPPLPEPSGCSF